MRQKTDKHRVFLSSVQREFGKERAMLAQRFATDAMLKEHFEFSIFEHMPAAFFSAEENYLSEVADSQMCLFLIGESVGVRDESNQAPVTYEILRAVIAEAVVNAVAHRDYQSSASVQVMLFPNRLEISNPGTLVPELSVARLKQDHASYPTNLLLAEILYQTGYIERFGTGTGEMFRLCKEAGLAVPEVELDEGFRIRFRREKAEATPHDNPQGSPQDGAQDGTQDEREIEDLSHRLVMILKGEMSTLELTKKFNMQNCKGFVRNYLQPALKKGLIEMTLPEKPTSKHQRYRLTTRGKRLKNALNDVR